MARAVSADVDYDDDDGWDLTDAEIDLQVPYGIPVSWCCPRCQRTTFDPFDVVRRDCRNCSALRSSRPPRVVRRTF
jgi:hypothetical protein